MHRLGTAGDHHLVVGVDIGEKYRCLRAVYLPDQRFYLCLVQADERGHAVTLRPGALHQLATQRDQAHGVVKGQRPRNHRCRISTDGQPGQVVRHTITRLQHACACDARDQQAKLNGTRGLQRPGGVQRQHVFAQRIGGFLQAVAHHGLVRQLMQHAGLLRTLAGKHPQAAHAHT